MLNRSTSLAMSTSVLIALPGKLDIKRHSPCILYFHIPCVDTEDKNSHKSSTRKNIIFCLFDVYQANFCVSATQLHKYVNVEVDPNQKSERPEWSTARYHALYSPQCGFELQVQWMVSTGGILGELVSSQ